MYALRPAVSQSHVLAERCHAVKLRADLKTDVYATKRKEVLGESQNLVLNNVHKS